MGRPRKIDVQFQSAEPDETYPNVIPVSEMRVVSDFAPPKIVAPDPVVNVPAQPVEKTIPIILKRGYWAPEGTLVFDPVYGKNDKGEKYLVGYEERRTPMNAKGDEAARKRDKLPVGTRLELSRKLAAALINEGKAEIDTGMSD